MLVITVHHLNREKTAHTAVAKVTTNTTNVLQALEQAFECTNHIDKAWYENDNVELLVTSTEFLRSSSVGDIFEVDGQRYECRPIGWHPKPPSPHAPALSGPTAPISGREPALPTANPDPKTADQNG